MLTDTDSESVRDMARFHYGRYVTEIKPPKSQLLDLARAQGFRALGVSLPECLAFRGVAVELGNGHQYVVYNTALPEELQTHYLAHEIYHLAADDPSGWDPEREIMADLYATTILLLLQRAEEFVASPKRVQSHA